MKLRPEHKLCFLIEDSLRPFNCLQDDFSVQLTKDGEKSLLICLSEVLRKTQIWTDEIDSDSDNQLSPDAGLEEEEFSSDCLSSPEPHCGAHDCLTKIVGCLISFLEIGSQYVQHLTGNVLVVISDYFLASGSAWNKLIQVLCVCLELSCSNAVFISLNHPSKVAMSAHNDSDTVIALRPKLEKANWSSVSCVIRVLRNILKQDLESQSLEVYMDTVHSCLTHLPWKSLDELYVCQNDDSILCRTIFGTKSVKSRTRLSGNLVQLFCSLVKQSGLKEASDESLCKHPVVSEICNLVPRLLGWCLCYEDRNLSISHYLRHKILVLMVRLSLRSQLKCSVLVSWLQLISEYFEDLLLLPIISQQESNQDDSLEDSPFLLNTSDMRKGTISSNHLQRLAVFLFLRCCFTLVQLKDGSSERCGCPSLKAGINSDSNSGCLRSNKGISELSWWLKRHVSEEVLKGGNFYSEDCVTFSQSFIRLFIQEDNLLFTVLLQLFYVPSCTNPRVFKAGSDIREMKDNTVFHVSNLLNPVHLFHLFLAELNYDHQVLLDYLISKDTGPSSAEYLLRSLRAICDSWNMFSEFYAGGKDTNMKDICESSGKKRKRIVDGSVLGHLIESAESSGSNVSPRKGFEKDLRRGSNHATPVKMSFNKAADCLLLLKASLENLHKKKLFPYNPEVLLRRLTRFQELFLEIVK